MIFRRFAPFIVLTLIFKSMKYIILLFILFCGNRSFAQENTSNKFHFGAYISPDVTNYLAISLNQKPGLALSAGIFSSKFISKRIEISLGATFSSINYTRPYINQWTIPDIKFRGKFLDIPLKCNVHFIKKSKFNVFVSVGAGAGFFLKSKTTTYLLPADGYEKRVNISNKSNPSVFPLLVFGAGIDYSIKNNWRLNLSPTFRTYFSADESSSGSSISRVYNAAGLTIGISHCF
jgi:outer membrane protein W